VEIQELARAVIAAGDSFYCRRLLQRLDREELELHEVLVSTKLRPAAKYVLPGRERKAH
jgi:hypothetical protein